jgi:hypothetical protein
VLSKLAYLTLCRSVQLLTQLARGDAAKDLEILVLRRLDAATQAGASRPGPARGDQPRPAPDPLVVLLRQARDTAALAPAHGRRRLDLPTPRTRTTADGPRRSAADPPAGQGEPALGLPTHQGRTPTPGEAGLGNRDPHDAAPPRAGPSPAPSGHDVAGVPTPAGRRDRCLRLVHRRHGLAVAAVRAVLHRTGYPPGPPGRGDP